jgi:hypothetical protein
LCARWKRRGKESLLQLVEQQVIKPADSRFSAIAAAAFAAKHLDHAALYVTRQAFIHEGRRVTDADLARDLKTSAEYRALPAKVGGPVGPAAGGSRLDRTSYFAACQAWQADPPQFLGHPTLPN